MKFTKKRSESFIMTAPPGREKPKLVLAYLDIAERMALCSTAVRKKVGCILVKDGQILSVGYNGTAPGHSNECELYKDHAHQVDRPIQQVYESQRERWKEDNPELDFPYTREQFVKDLHPSYLKTKETVFHAEENCLGKMAKSGASAEGSAMYLTLSPCIHCSKLIFTSGVKTVYYSQYYDNPEGRNFLVDHGVEVYRVERGYPNAQALQVGVTYREEKVWHYAVPEETRQGIQRISANYHDPS